MGNELRNSTIQHLRNIAELNELVGPTELVCGWFDDLYLPESKKFVSQFSRDELSAIQKFHKAFESVASDLPMGSDWRRDNKMGIS